MLNKNTEEYLAIGWIEQAELDFMEDFRSKTIEVILSGKRTLIDKFKWYKTRDGQEIPGVNVTELDKDGFVIMSGSFQVMDFTKDKYATTETD